VKGPGTFVSVATEEETSSLVTGKRIFYEKHSAIDRSTAA
jgi:hypothetical protein